MSGMSIGTITAILAAVDQISPVVSKVTGNVSGGMDKIKGAVAGAFTVGAVTEMVNKLATVSGRLTDLSAKTGVGTTALQKLEMAFGASGVSIDSVTNAIGEMGRRLISGDSGALHGIEQLGLKTADLITMAPDAAFTKIADAIAGIENPMERATAAQEIFGKGGKEVLAGLDGHLAETTAAYERMGLVLSEDVIKAGDEFGDTMGVLEATGMALIANVIGPLLPGLTAIAQTIGSLAQNAVPWLQQQFDSLLTTGLKLVRSYYDMRAAFALTETAAASFREKAREVTDQITMFTTVLPKVEEPAKHVAAVVGTYGEAAKAASEKTKQLADEQRKAAEAFRESVSFVQVTTRGYVAIAQAVEDSRAEIDEVRQSMEAMNDITLNDVWTPFLAGVKDSQDGVDALNAKLRTLKWQDVGKNLSNSILGALQGGGDIGKALGGSAGQMLGTKLGTSVGDWAGKAIGGSLGAAIGGAAGSILPVVGTMLGSVAGSFVGKLFGGGEGKAANNLRDQIISQAGGFHELARKAVEAGTSIDALLRARDTKGVQAAAAALDAALNGRASQIQLAKQAMEEFGISADQAGQAFKQAEMDETARSITEKLEAMMSIGVSTDAIIAGAGDEIGAFIQRAIEMGTTVPKEWQPIVQKMIDAGTLVDANGEKLTDMGKVPFAETLNDKIGAVMDKLSAFIDRIMDVPDALGRIPRDIEINFNGRWNGDGEFPGFRSGSGGLRDFGSGTPVMLHGREEVRTEAQKARDEAALSRGAQDQDAKFVTLFEFMQFKLPLAIRDAMQQGAM